MEAMREAIERPREQAPSRSVPLRSIAESTLYLLPVNQRVGTCETQDLEGCESRAPDTQSVENDEGHAAVNIRGYSRATLNDAEVENPLVALHAKNIACAILAWKSLGTAESRFAALFLGRNLLQNYVEAADISIWCARVCQLDYDYARDMDDLFEVISAPSSTGKATSIEQIAYKSARGKLLVRLDELDKEIVALRSECLPKRMSQYGSVFGYCDTRTNDYTSAGHFVTSDRSKDWQYSSSKVSPTRLGATDSQGFTWGLYDRHKYLSRLTSTFGKLATPDPLDRRGNSLWFTHGFSAGVFDRTHRCIVNCMSIPSHVMNSPVLVGLCFVSLLPVAMAVDPGPPDIRVLPNHFGALTALGIAGVAYVQLHLAPRVSGVTMGMLAVAWPPIRNDAHTTPSVLWSVLSFWGIMTMVYMHCRFACHGSVALSLLGTFALTMLITGLLSSPQQSGVTGFVTYFPPALSLSVFAISHVPALLEACREVLIESLQARRTAVALDLERGSSTVAGAPN